MEGVRAWLRRVQDIPLDKRIYADETPVFANEAPKRGRSRRGANPSFGLVRDGPRSTLCMYSRSGVVSGIGI
jgi:hypothetical protein